MLAKIKRWVRSRILIPQFQMLAHSKDTLQLSLTAEHDRLRTMIKASMPDSPAVAGFKAYSQADEDGILGEIFKRLGIDRGVFVEIGCSDGLENNTHFLALKGWRGVWIDADAEKVSYVQQHLPDVPHGLRVRAATMTPDNALAIVRKELDGLGAAALELLSVDIDGNDLFVTLPLVTALTPSVLIVEYNAKVRWPATCTAKMLPGESWLEDDYQGASLAAWVSELSPAYLLVACNLAGTNAFFVRDDLRQGFTAYPPWLVEQPARYFLTGLSSGHPASLRFLADALTRRTQAPALGCNGPVEPKD